MDSAKTRGVGFCLAAAFVALTGAHAHAQEHAAHGPFMVRLQLEPGALLARQNGPLTLALNSLGVTGSLTAGVNLATSTVVGAEIWFGIALVPSLDITAPDFDGAGETVSVEGPTLTTMLVGPNITQVFDQEAFSVSATVGAAFGSFDYDSYDVEKLPYNRRVDENELPLPKEAIPLDKTNVGFGFGVALAKQLTLADHLWLGVGVQFRYLAVPDDAVYFDYSGRGNLRFRADVWSITSFGLHASITYF